MVDLQGVGNISTGGMHCMEHTKIKREHKKLAGAERKAIMAATVYTGNNEAMVHTVEKTKWVSSWEDSEYSSESNLPSYQG